MAAAGGAPEDPLTCQAPARRRERSPRARYVTVTPSLQPGKRSEARYPGEVAVPAGEAGQTRDAVILTSQVRTVSLRRVRGAPIGVVDDPRLRHRVRVALAHHRGLDVPAMADGARP